LTESGDFSKIKAVGTQPIEKILRRVHQKLTRPEWLWCATAAMLMCLPGCQTAPQVRPELHLESLKDGKYEGSYRNGPNSARVAVTIKNKRVEAVTVLRHFSSWVGKGAETVIPARIVAAQSVDVDVVSGATNSSRVIMNAARNALEGAVETP
jgi:uncharacterized protein with FMN-binding domain